MIMTGFGNCIYCIGVHFSAVPTDWDHYLFLSITCTAMMHTSYENLNCSSRIVILILLCFIFIWFGLCRWWCKQRHWHPSKNVWNGVHTSSKKSWRSKVQWWCKCTLTNLFWIAMYSKRNVLTAWAPLTSILGYCTKNMITDLSCLRLFLWIKKNYFLLLIFAVFPDFVCPIPPHIGGGSCLVCPCPSLTCIHVN